MEVNKITSKIKTISIKAFRGIPSLDLILDGKGLILKGENGSGKSSLIDALEFLFTGTISHLEGTQGLSLEEHAPHTKFKPEDIEIDVTFDPGNIQLKRKFKLDIAKPENLKDYLRITQRGTFILRRAQLLNFIISKPAERFKAIGDIIGIGSLDSLELEMKSLQDELKSNVDFATQTMTNILKDISKMTGMNINKREETLLALNNLLKNTGIPPINSIIELEIREKEMIKNRGKINELDNIKLVLDLINGIKEIVNSSKFLERAEELSNNLYHFLNDKNKDYLFVVNLLDMGNVLLKDKNLDHCPLCEQKIEYIDLLTSITSRLDILKATSNEATKIRNNSGILKSSLTKYIEKLEILCIKLINFKDLNLERDELDKNILLIKPILLELDYNREIKSNFSIEPLRKIYAENERVLTEVSKKVSIIKSSLISNDEDRKFIDSINVIEKVRNKIEEIDKLCLTYDVINKRYKLTEKIYTIFVDVKKRKTQEVYEIIQKDISKFYSTLHQNDPHKNIEIRVASGKRASADLTIESFGRKEQDPRALTSEGHLDSLGLCIFLAFVKKFNVECSLIVLDDIVSTIDSNHRGYICNLLFEEFRDKQLIVTTHDNVWYQQLIDAQKAYKLDGSFINKSIVNWSVDDGLVFKSYKPKFEEIIEKIQEGNDTGNMARIYLESILKKISKMIRVLLPLSEDGNYAMSDLYTNVKGRLLNLIDKNDPFYIEIEKALKELDCTLFMGNISSHDNSLNLEVAPAEIERFCRAVKEIEDLFVCSNCDTSLVYSRDLNIIRCPDIKCNKPIEIKTK